VLLVRDLVELTARTLAGRGSVAPGRVLRPEGWWRVRLGRDSGSRSHRRIAFDLQAVLDPLGDDAAGKLPHCMSESIGWPEFSCALKLEGQGGTVEARRRRSRPVQIIRAISDSFSRLCSTSSTAYSGSDISRRSENVLFKPPHRVGGRPRSDVVPVRCQRHSAACDWCGPERRGCGPVGC
jgi:hypothetical protein